MSDIAGLMKINIRAKSIENAKTVFETILGAELLHDRGSNTIGDFDGATYKVGDLVLDILAPNDPDGRLAKNLEKRGEGLDSLCFKVGSLEAVRQRLEGAGIKMIDVQEFHGSKIGFVHPRDCCGVLLEFIEPVKQD